MGIEMDKDLRVSIIIPVFNCEQYIEECLNSAINQSYKNIEIIVIDDG
ncbi:MAG: glycosyltransferase, partial [Eubacterium sp.]|nr:glycosyltransferase [Eubacterium sp.]